MLIPKKIFQTFKTTQLPEGMKQAQQTWAVKDFAYNFYDDKQCLDFIKKHFSQNEVNAFIDLVPGAFKADLFRLCALYIHGEVYSTEETTIVLTIESQAKLRIEKTSIAVINGEGAAPATK